VGGEDQQRRRAALHRLHLPADGVARAERKAAVRGAERNEVRATMKYVALDGPQVWQYVIEAARDGKRWRVTMNGEGGDVKATELKEEKKEEKKDKGDKPADKEKEIDVPEKAAKAVKAIKGLHPDAVVKGSRRKCSTTPAAPIQSR
jgi:hypothetical protein